MPLDPPPPERRMLVVAYDPTVRLEALEEIATGDVLARWRSVDRSAHHPRIVAVLEDDGHGWAGAVLVTARPHTAYLKIVDVVGDIGPVVAAVLAYARSSGVVQVKWEGWTAGDAPLAAGFTPMRSPAGEGVCRPETGYVRWLHGAPVSEPRHYQQTTHFTCGAVAALTALAETGAIDAQSIDRSAELTLWRAATNFPACEPVGLAVAIRRRWQTADVAVSLDTSDPVILDSYPEGERVWRAVLQRASRDEARELGVPIDAQRMSLGDMRDAVEAGDRILLLISLDRMLGVGAPHWVLCHGAVPGAVVIQDSWVDAGVGATWVDSHLLPVGDAALDEMSRMEAGRYRGVVRIRNGSSQRREATGGLPRPRDPMAAVVTGRRAGGSAR